MTKLILAALLVISPIAVAADPPQIKFALSAHEGDDTTPVLINLAVPPGTTHRLQATDHLTFEISVAPIKNGRVDTWSGSLTMWQANPCEWRTPNGSTLQP